MAGGISAMILASRRKRAMLILLKIPPIPPPPPESSLIFFTFVGGAATSGDDAAGAGAFGCDIFLVFLTFRLHSVEDEEEHYAAYWYEYEGEEVHEREHIYSSQVTSD